MSAADGLPRVWVTRRRVYIQWPQWNCDGAKPTAVINLGSYLDDIVAWPQRVPAGAVELVLPEHPGGQP